MAGSACGKVILEAAGFHPMMPARFGLNRVARSRVVQSKSIARAKIKTQRRVGRRGASCGCPFRTVASNQRATTRVAPTGAEKHLTKGPSFAMISLPRRLDFPPFGSRSCPGVRPMPVRPSLAATFHCDHGETGFHLPSRKPNIFQPAIVSKRTHPCSGYIWGRPTLHSVQQHELCATWRAAHIVCSRIFIGQNQFKGRKRIYLRDILCNRKATMLLKTLYLANTLTHLETKIGRFSALIDLQITEIK